MFKNILNLIYTLYYLKDKIKSIEINSSNILCFNKQLAIEGLHNSLSLEFKLKFFTIDHDKKYVSNLKSISHSLFMNLVNLKQLKLQINLYLHPGIFSDLANLTILCLKNSKIEQIKKGLFDGLTKIKFLNLTDCGISSIDDFCFSDLCSLTDLFLSDNNFETINKNLFVGLINLRVLHLCECNIRNIENNSFLELGKLDTLNLSHNNLKYINVSIFNGLNELANINLISNPIEKIDDSNIFVNLKYKTLKRKSV